MHDTDACSNWLITECTFNFIIPSGNTVPPLMTDQPSLADTVAEAEQLKESFLSLSADAMWSARDSGLSAETVVLKTTSLWQYHNSTPPGVQVVMAELDSNVTSADAAIRFLISQNLLGYMNFMMLKYALGSLFALSSPNLVEMINSYQRLHAHFARHNPLKNISAMFERRPDLAPMCLAGLPEVRFILNDSWKDRSLEQWKELMADVGISPDHLLIKTIDIAGAGRMCCAIVPFFLPTVTRWLREETVIKALTRTGVTALMDEDVWRVGSLEDRHIGQVIKHADTMIVTENQPAASSTGASYTSTGTAAGGEKRKVSIGKIFMAQLL